MYKYEYVYIHANMYIYRHAYIHVGCIFPGDGYRSYGDNYVAYISMRSISITQLKADEKLFTDSALFSILKYSLRWKDLKVLDITDNVCVLESKIEETKLILLKIEEYLTRLIIISGRKRFQHYKYTYRLLEANPHPNHGMNGIPWLSMNSLLFNTSVNSDLSIGVRHPLILKNVLLEDRRRLMNN